MSNQHVCLFFAINQFANIFYIKCNVPELKGDNYKVCSERVLLHLGWMNIGYVISQDEPPSINETSTPDVVDLYEKWERSNRLSMMFIKTKSYASIRSFVDQHEKVKDLLKGIDLLHLIRPLLVVLILKALWDKGHV